MMDIFGSTVDPWVFWTFILVLIGTLITVWRFVRDWWTNRRRLIINTSKLLPKDEIMTAVTNKTGQQIKFYNIGFRCKGEGSFEVGSKLHTTNGTDWTVDDKGRRCVILDNNSRYTFWLSIKDIKKRHSKLAKYKNWDSVKCVSIRDFHGRTHEGRIPNSIKKLLNK